MSNPIPINKDDFGSEEFDFEDEVKEDSEIHTLRQELRKRETFVDTSEVLTGTFRNSYKY